MLYVNDINYYEICVCLTLDTKQQMNKMKQNIKWNIINLGHGKHISWNKTENTLKI